MLTNDSLCSSSTGWSELEDPSYSCSGIACISSIPKPRPKVPDFEISGKSMVVFDSNFLGLLSIFIFEIFNSVFLPP